MLSSSAGVYQKPIPVSRTSIIPVMQQAAPESCSDTTPGRSVISAGVSRTLERR